MELKKDQTLYAEHKLSNIVEVITIVDITEKTISYITSEEVATRRTLQHFYNTYTPIEEILVKENPSFFEANLFTIEENLKIKLDSIVNSITDIYKDITKLEANKLEKEESDIAVSELLEEIGEEREFEIKDGITKLN